MGTTDVGRDIRTAQTTQKDARVVLVNIIVPIQIRVRTGDIRLRDTNSSQANLQMPEVFRIDIVVPIKVAGGP